MKQGKVWGETCHLFGKNNVSIHRIEIKSGGYCSKHKHNHKYNLFFVEKGDIEVHVWKNDYDLKDVTKIKEGESTTVKPGEYHKFFNRSESTAIVYEIYWTELNENDIVREDVGGSVGEEILI